MRTLYLLRHAKSSWDDPSLDDFERPLARRGERAAPVIAEYMRREGLVPDLVLCSAARRTLDTWKLAAPILGPDIPVQVAEALYTAPPGRVLERLRSQPDDVSTVMVVGHNPTIQELACRLSGAGSKKAMKRLGAKYPTAALAVITFASDHWEDVEPEGGYLERFVRAKDVERA